MENKTPRPASGERERAAARARRSSVTHKTGINLSGVRVGVSVAATAPENNAGEDGGQGSENQEQRLPEETEEEDQDEGGEHLGIRGGWWVYFLRMGFSGLGPVPGPERENVREQFEEDGEPDQEELKRPQTRADRHVQDEPPFQAAHSWR